MLQSLYLVSVDGVSQRWISLASSHRGTMRGECGKKIGQGLIAGATVGFRKATSLAYNKKPEGAIPNLGKQGCSCDTELAASTPTEKYRQKAP